MLRCHPAIQRSLLLSSGCSLIAIANSACEPHCSGVGDGPLCWDSGQRKGQTGTNMNNHGPPTRRASLWMTRHAMKICKYVIPLACATNSLSANAVGNQPYPAIPPLLPSSPMRCWCDRGRCPGWESGGLGWTTFGDLYRLFVPRVLRRGGKAACHLEAKNAAVPLACTWSQL